MHVKKLPSVGPLIASYIVHCDGFVRLFSSFSAAHYFAYHYANSHRGKCLDLISLRNFRVSFYFFSLEDNCVKIS